MPRVASPLAWGLLLGSEGEQGGKIQTRNDRWCCCHGKEEIGKRVGNFILLPFLW